MNRRWRYTGTACQWIPEGAFDRQKKAKLLPHGNATGCLVPLHPLLWRAPLAIGRGRRISYMYVKINIHLIHRSIYACMCIYIYIYTYYHTHIIYTYISVRGHTHTYTCIHACIHRLITYVDTSIAYIDYIHQLRTSHTSITIPNYDRPVVTNQLCGS